MWATKSPFFSAYSPDIRSIVVRSDEVSTKSPGLLIRPLEENARSGERPRLAWSPEERRSFPYTPTVPARGDSIYIAPDKGGLARHNARTGEEVWSLRWQCLFTVSPVVIDGKVYTPSEPGDVCVFEAAPKYKLLAKNNLGEPVFASPAVAHGRLYIRGKQHLFCVGQAAPRRSAETK